MNTFKIKDVNDYQAFCNLSIKEKEKILKRVSNILKINENRRFSFEKKKIKYLENLCDYLDYDALNKNLNYKQDETFRIINRIRFINGLGICKDALEAYFNNSFLRKNKYSYDDLNILLQNTIIYLMNYFNYPFKSITISDKYYNYNTSYLHQEMYLELSKNVLDNASSKFIEEDKFLKMAVKQTWSLAHEFAHTAINHYLEKCKFLEDDILFKEIVIMLYNNNFYMENHNDFCTEMIANDFSLDFATFLLQGIFDSKKVLLEINKLQRDIEHYKTNISLEEIDDEYKNILMKKDKEKTLSYVKSLLKKRS